MKKARGKRLRVAFDIDDTIADISRIVMRKVNRHLKSSHTFKEVIESKSNKGSVLWPTYIRFYRDLWVNRHTGIRLLIDKKLMKNVREYYDVAFVSARGRNSITSDALRKWLRMQGLEGVPLYLTDTSDEKASLKYDIYVDDYPLMVKGKRQLLLVHQHHNMHVKESENVIRFYGVNEALRFLLSRARGQR